jgi:hypothetical protein
VNIEPKLVEEDLAWHRFIEPGKEFVCGLTGATLVSAHYGTGVAFCGGKNSHL